MRDLDLGRYGVVPEAAIEWRFTPSGGPGGQHANKTSTRVEARIDIAALELPAYARERALERVGDELKVVVDEERSQSRNRAIACDRLEAALKAAVAPPPAPRRPTRPSKAAVQRRLDDKRRTAERKRARRPPD